MSTTDTERYVRITLLTFEGGLWIARKILMREVDRSGALTLDDLLLGKNTLLKGRHDITKRQYETLFPVSGNDTNIAEWDLSLLIKIIKILFDHVLSGQDLYSLDELLRIRNEIVCHAIQPSLSGQDFYSHWGQITMCIGSLASHFDVTTTQYATDLTKRLSKGPLDLQSSIEQIAKLCRNDENVLESLATQERKLKDVASEVALANQKIDDVLTVVRELQRTQTEREEDICRVVIPLLNTTVCISGKKDDVVKLAQDILLKIHKAAIDKVEHPDDEDTVRDAVQQFLADIESKGSVVVSAESGSIILKIRCNDLDGLDNMLSLFRDNESRCRLSGIENALNAVLLDAVKVELVLPDDTIAMLREWIDLGLDLPINPATEGSVHVHINDLASASEEQSRTEAKTVPEYSGQDPTRAFSDLLRDNGDIDESKLAKMLQAGVLPVQSDIQTAFELLKDGRLSTNIFDIMCNAVCEHIKHTIDRLSSVRACYTAQAPEQVVFVAMTDRDIAIDPGIVHTVKICHPDGYSEEGTSITYHDQRRSKRITQEESKEISVTIQEHADYLLKNHSNIQMMSGCSVKSRMFGKDNPVLDLQTCVVIYVNVKGVIPIYESVLPRYLPIPNSTRRIPIDVREGGMHFASKVSPTEFHQHLKMGCQIHTAFSYGTLGPIIAKTVDTPSDSKDHMYERKIYCLTSAHMFFENPDSRHQQFIELMKYPGIYVKKDNDGIPDILMYQNSDQPFGVVQHAAFLSGNTRHAGIDVAVIEITDKKRLPCEGSFPKGNMEAAGFDDANPMKFCSGKVYDEAGFFEQARHHSEVVKYGCETECTKGIFDVQGLVVKRTDYPAQYNALNRTLYNQLSVLAIGDPNVNPFAMSGDSGALVFAKHDGIGKDLRAVGIIEGVTSNKMVVVTPIWDIFRHLNLKTDEGLMRFDISSLSEVDSGYISSNRTTPSLYPSSGPEDDASEQERSQELARHFYETKEASQRQVNALERRFNSRLDHFIEETERMHNEQTNHIQNLRKHQAKHVQQQNKVVLDLKQQQQQLTGAVTDLQKQQAEHNERQTKTVPDLQRQQELLKNDISCKIDSSIQSLQTQQTEQVQQQNQAFLELKQQHEQLNKDMTIKIENSTATMMAMMKELMQKK